jgi:hypothetical protein
MELRNQGRMGWLQDIRKLAERTHPLAPSLEREGEEVALECV